MDAYNLKLVGNSDVSSSIGTAAYSSYTGSFKGDGSGLTGLITGSGGVDNYNLLTNKPTVGNIGINRFLYNNNSPSQSIAATNISYSTMSVNYSGYSSADVFNLKNNTRLVFFTTSSTAGSNHHILNKTWMYEVTGSLYGSIQTPIQIPVEFANYEGTLYTGSVNNAAIMYNVKSLIFSTTGSNGIHGAYAWSSTVEGRTTVSGMNSGQMIHYVPLIVSGGMGLLGAYGGGPPSGSNYDNVHIVTFSSGSNSNLVLITHKITVPTPIGTVWDCHGSITINQIIYEVDGL